MVDLLPERGVRPGAPYPLGAHWVGDGTNFAVYSQHATSIEICLFEDGDDAPSSTIALPERTNFVWHGWLQEVNPGTKYGIRAHGPYTHEAGIRFNPAKLLVDPYARALSGEVAWGADMYGYDLSDPDDDLAVSITPNDGSVPKSIVINPSFVWGDDRHPQTPWVESVFYEAHVTGLTKLHPDVPEHHRGTYLGVAHDSVIAHLKKIGVTAIELLPVHSHVDDQFLVQKGLCNYWGYSTLGFFSPHAHYATGPDGREVIEFKQMVKALHAEGIEVILDVVYNHTCEGNHHGPTLSFRGLDNRNYYHLLPDKPEYYLDFTGTGNSIKAAHPQVLTLILDSLRYWVEEMHVDGFRFDLATTLGREHYEFNAWGGFFDAIHQDPILSQVKMIAEPWDVGEGGYQVGGFPVLWSEWNDKFRDATRAFWQADSRAIAEMGYRLTGSSDIYEASGRGPRSSVNLITTHDGFTLADLVSYSKKHNDANGEGNRDGHGHNLSANYGHEGATDDPAICGLRRRQQRNLLATLMLSQGVPLLLGGDEFNRTQQGNNNAYCQDNELSWFDWDHDDEAREMIDYVSHLSGIRRAYPILRRRRFFKGLPATPNSLKDISWIKPDGNDMTDGDWAAGAATIGLRMAGNSIDESDALGASIATPTLLMIIHASAEPTSFVLPRIDREEAEHTWEVVLDTDNATGASEDSYPEQAEIQVPGRTVLLMQGGPAPD
ncbi:MAG: glycogen debranching protein GlgX [Chloroflexia bacterium]|nr:glycogen debranching protein GlgX [Chloroflexia bacterium]